MHDRDHYAVMEIDILVKKVVIFDRLYKNLEKWMDHVVSGMKRCMLLGLNDMFCHMPDEPSVSNVGGSKRPQKAIHGYSLLFCLEEWRLVRGNFVKQVDTFYCGPIACLKILERSTTSQLCMRLIWCVTPIPFGDLLSMSGNGWLLIATTTSFCVSGNVFYYLNLGLRMERHLQQHVGLTPQLMLQLPLQLLLLLMLRKQIWTYASAAVTHNPWNLFVLPAAKKRFIASVY
jgi:hypothetical protein